MDVDDFAKFLSIRKCMCSCIMFCFILIRNCKKNTNHRKTKQNKTPMPFYRSLRHTTAHLVYWNISTPQVHSQRENPSVGVAGSKERKGKDMAHSTCAPAVDKSASHSVTITRKGQSDYLVYLLFDEFCCSESNFSQMHVFRVYVTVNGR